jgi:hypothetical protein
MKKALLMFAVVAAGASPAVHASFTAFQGGLTAQADWQLAAAPFVLETFETYPAGTRVGSLPLLGLTFENLVDGLPPGIYPAGTTNTPSGMKQLSNFSGICCGDAFAYGDVVAHVDAGVDLTAFGFWNGDPQGDAVLRVYDRGGSLMGSVTAALNTAATVTTSNSFAGFVTDVPVGRLEWEGNVGDGWNHYDDFQASVTAAVPEPEIYASLAFGFAVLGAAARRRRRQG